MDELRSVFDERFCDIPWVVANRSDGLGERLNALLNAVFLSLRLGYRFGYKWDSELHKFAKEANSQKTEGLIGHAIVSESQLFEESFIQKYSLPNLDTKDFQELLGSSLDREKLREVELNNGLRGWIAPRTHLKNFLSERLAPGSRYSYRKAFEHIKFHSDVQNVIHHARSYKIPPEFTAIHLRSGDVFYGPYRKFVHYTYKGITLPICKGIIAKLKEDGDSVILFGQDLSVLKYLKENFSIDLAIDLYPNDCKSDLQKAIFEIVLMSRAKKIVGGSSGFVRFAANIGGIDLLNPNTFFSHQEQTILSVQDLAANAADYHPLQAAFSYWYSYYYGRQFKSLDTSISLLENAYLFDPDNQLYPLVMAALLFKDRRNKDGNELLRRLLRKEREKHLFSHLPSFAVLSAKTMGRFNLEEYFPYFDLSPSMETPYSLLFSAKIDMLTGKDCSAKSKILRACKMDPKDFVLREGLLNMFPEEISMGKKYTLMNNQNEGSLSFSDTFLKREVRRIKACIKSNSVLFHRLFENGRKSHLPKIRVQQSFAGQVGCPICLSAQKNDKVVVTYPYSSSRVFRSAKIQGCCSCGCSFVSHLKLNLKEFYEGHYSSFQGRDRLPNPEEYFSNLEAAPRFKRSKEHVKLLMKYAGNAKRVLEYGPGFGTTLALLRSDTEKYALEKDRVAQRYLEYLGVKCISEKEASEMKFDAVLTSHSIEHLWFEELDPTIKMFWNFLESGGIVLCQVPTGNLLQCDLTRAKHEPHTLFFTLQGLDILFKRHGFKRLFLKAMAKEEMPERKDVWYSPPADIPEYGSRAGGLTIIAQKP